MSAQGFRDHDNALELLRQFVRRPKNVEQCELCGLELGEAHQHLFEPSNRKVLCSCDACVVLLSGRANARFKRVPRNVRFLEDFHLTDARWDSLMIPINMAFIFKSSPEERMMAMYPSPAGATESLLPLETWSEIVQHNPALDTMEPDVEALLVNRIGHSRGFSAPEYYLLPIDECFKLVGVIRLYWKGFSGGAELWKEVAHFFTELKRKAVAPAEGAHA